MFTELLALPVGQMMSCSLILGFVIGMSLMSLGAGRDMILEHMRR